MAAAFVEHRPRSTDPGADTKYYVYVVESKDSRDFSTQAAAKKAACDAGYRPVHVARVRHLQDRDNPDHWRKDPC